MSSSEIRKILKLLEATQTQTKTKDETDFDDFDIGGLMGDTSSKGELSTSTKSSSPAASKMGQTHDKEATSRMAAQAGSKLDTDAAASVSASMMQKMQDAGMDIDFGDFGDEDNAPPAPANTLPANIRKDLDTINGPNVNWHQLSDTPNYRMFVQAFAPLFKSFHMDIAKTKVVTTLTSEQADVQKLVAYLNNNAEKDDNFSLEAFDIDPAQYHIEGAVMYKMAGESYMVMQERLGNRTNWYVYSAPTQGGDQLGGEAPKQLR